MIETKDSVYQSKKVLTITKNMENINDDFQQLVPDQKFYQSI